MKQLTYALWLKNNVDFSTHPGLVNVITAAFNGIGHYSNRFTFTQYPPEYESDVLQLTSLVTSSGLSITEGSFISLIQFGSVKTYVANIHLPMYGNDSFVRWVVYGSEAVAQQFDLSGSNFINLTIYVNAQWNVFLTGSGPMVRNWDPFNALPFAFLGGRGGPFWSLTIPMLRGETLEFKIVLNNGEYESGPNRTYTAGDTDDQISISL